MDSETLSIMFLLAGGVFVVVSALFFTYRKRGLALVSALLCVAFCLGVFVVTHYDLRWPPYQTVAESPTAPPIVQPQPYKKPSVEEFDPAKYKGPTGRIITSYRGESTMTLLKDDESQEFTKSGFPARTARSSSRSESIC